MNIDLENIKKLPPSDRRNSLIEIRDLLLKEMNKLKIQISEVEDLIGIAEDEGILLEEISVPKAKKIDISKLFVSKDNSSLEEQIRKLPEEQRKTIEALSQQPIEELYIKVKTLSEITVGYGRINQDNKEDDIYQRNQEFEKRRAIYEVALMEKRKAVEKGEYKIDSKKEHLMTAAEKLTYKRI